MSMEDILHPLLSRYIASPQWVKNFAGKMYSWIPLSIRKGMHYQHFLEESEIRNAETLANLSQTKLKQSLRWAIEDVPAYQKYSKFLKEIDSNPESVLSELPLTSKEDIKHDLEKYLSRKLDAKSRLRMYTGGSTSTPMMFFLQKGVSRTKEFAYISNFQNRINLTEKDIVLALRGRTVPTANTPNGKMWMYEPIKKQLILSSDHLERKYMPEYVNGMQEWQPRHIEAFPSAIYPLARWFKENPNIEVTQKIKGILLYSENAYDNQLDLLREVFGCPVLRHYGHSERILMAASMPDDDRCFFWPQYGYFELIDHNGEKITKPGILGEIVGTGFDNQVMSFVRYKTGDMATLSDKPQHALLPGFPAVERIEGRLQEFIVCNDNRLISICTMGAAHFESLSSVESIQYEQHVPGHFTLKVACTNRLTSEIRQRIESAVTNKTQGGCTVDVQEVDSIPRTTNGKHKMLIQHIDIGNFFGGN